MKKRSVGIYAAYDASEQCLCAAFLARYIVSCYRYVHWFVPHAPGPKDRTFGFSHQWDTEVLEWHPANQAIRDAVKSCDTFFFFMPNRELFDLLPVGTVTACVFDPRTRGSDTLRFARKCAWPLVTSGEWTRQYPSLALWDSLTVWPFAPSIPCALRRDLDYEQQPRLFFPACGLTLSERMFVEQTAELVKLCLPNVRTVVGFYDAGTEAAPGVDSRTHDWRILRYLQNSDWLIDLNPRPFYTLLPALAGGYGLQWAGFDLIPHTGDDCSARRHLVETRLDRNHPQYGVKAVPDLEDTAEQIVRLLTTPFHGELDRHRGSGAWDNRRAEFLRVTNRILGIKSRY